jgi:integrating conjugative element relaxase (TIGR03760 family)
VAGSQPQWLRVLDAHTLLQVVPCEKAIEEIWRKSGFSRPVFERDCLSALLRYAEFVQLMPASESHHHAHVGGLLAHTIEMLLAAMTWRNGYLLPSGAPIEQIDAQRDKWTLVVFYAALLHDIGKALTDLRVSWRAKHLEAVRWMPLAGSLVELAQGRAQAEYLVEFTARVERDYGAHSRTAIFLLQHVASPEALALLARLPSVFEALNRYLCGQDKDSLVAQIVRAADKASVQRALATGSRARFATARAVPLIDLLMGALRAMLRDGAALPLNRSGAAGWVYDGSLWLVAKRAADTTRTWIQEHESGEAVPGETKNDRLFDTWQEYGCIEPNPQTGQAVWYVTVHGADTDTPEAKDGVHANALKQDAYMSHPGRLDPDFLPAKATGFLLNNSGF